MSRKDRSAIEQDELLFRSTISLLNFPQAAIETRAAEPLSKISVYQHR